MTSNFTRRHPDITLAAMLLVGMGASVVGMIIGGLLWLYLEVPGPLFVWMYGVGAIAGILAITSFYNGIE